VKPQVLAILSFAAPIERGAAVIDGLKRIPEVAGDAGAARFAAVAATGVGAFGDALALYAPSIAGLRMQGRAGLLARALALEAWSAALHGDPGVAITAAGEGAGLARETAQPLMEATAQVAHAIAAALRGELEATESLAAEAEQTALRIGAGAILSATQLARGVAALASGRNADAYEHLARMYDPADLAYHRAIGCFAIADLADAAVHSGRHADAAAVVARLEALADLTPSPRLHDGLRYARALLAPDDEAEALFHAALDADMAHWPFLRARVQFAYGAWLRRQRRVADSRAPLRAARESFDALGTVPWGEHARQELRASGETSRRRAPEARDQLTAQELQIAQMAADGLTNREIGQRLYLSHRTVSTHLYRIFPKLGVTARAELRGALSDAALVPA
jgi:DNA-binding CsgD family transcriptional regulator